MSSPPKILVASLATIAILLATVMLAPTPAEAHSYHTNDGAYVWGFGQNSPPMTWVQTGPTQFHLQTTTYSFLGNSYVANFEVPPGDDMQVVIQVYYDADAGQAANRFDVTGIEWNGIALSHLADSDITTANNQESLSVFTETFTAKIGDVWALQSAPLIIYTTNQDVGSFAAVAKWFEGTNQRTPFAASAGGYQGLIGDDDDLVDTTIGACAGASPKTIRVGGPAAGGTAADQVTPVNGTLDFGAPQGNNLASRGSPATSPTDVVYGFGFDLKASGCNLAQNYGNHEWQVQTAAGIPTTADWGATVLEIESYPEIIPVLQIDVNPAYGVLEGHVDSGKYTIFMGNTWHEEIQVFYALSGTTDDNASASPDHNLTYGTYNVTFQPGEYKAQYPFTIYDDELDEKRENIKVEITEVWVDGAKVTLDPAGCGVTGQPATACLSPHAHTKVAVVDLRDNELSVDFSNPASSADEAAGEVDVEFSIFDVNDPANVVFGHDAVINFSVSTPNSLEHPANPQDFTEVEKQGYVEEFSYTGKAIPINITDDTIDEFDQQLLIEITGAYFDIFDGSQGEYNLIVRNKGISNHTFTIIDNDPLAILSVQNQATLAKEIQESSWNRNYTFWAEIDRQTEKPIKFTIRDVTEDYTSTTATYGRDYTSPVNDTEYEVNKTENLATEMEWRIDLDLDASGDQFGFVFQDGCGENPREWISYELGLLPDGHLALQTSEKTALFHIEDKEGRPMVTFANAAASQIEGTPPDVPFTTKNSIVGVSPTPCEDITVAYQKNSYIPDGERAALANAQGANPQDYVLPDQGTITFGTDGLSGSIPIQIVPDNIDELNEFFSFDLLNYVEPQYWRFNESSILRQTFEIIDDDTVRLNSSWRQSSIREGNITNIESPTDPVAKLDIWLDKPVDDVVDTWARTVRAWQLTADEQANVGVDLQELLQEVTFAPFSTEKTVDVPIYSDDVVEGKEFVLHNLTATDAIDPNLGGYISRDGELVAVIWNHTLLDGQVDRHLAILDDDSATIELSPIAIMDNETARNDPAIKATFSNLVDEEVYLQFNVLPNGSITYEAIKVQDLDPVLFGASPVSAIVPAMTKEWDIELGIIGDVYDEPAIESFTIRGNQDSARIVENVTLGTTQLNGQIHDDDDTPTLFVDDVIVRESAGNAAFCGKLKVQDETGAWILRGSRRAITADVTIVADTATGDGKYADYNPITATLDFSAGPLETPIHTQCFQVPIINDDWDEERIENFTVEVSIPTPADDAVVILNPENTLNGKLMATGSIIDDDAVTISIQESLEVAESADATWDIQLSNRSQLPIDVTINVIEGTATLSAPADLIQPTQLTLRVDPYNFTRQIVVPIVDDALDEDVENFRTELVALKRIGPMEENQVLMGDNVTTVNITDNDLPPIVTLDAPTILEGNDGQKSLIWNATLSEASGRIVSFEWATQNGIAIANEDFIGSNGTAIFLPANATHGAQVKQQLVVPIYGDNLVEGNEGLAVVVSNYLNTEPRISKVSPIQTTWAGTIIDDDRLEVTIGNLSQIEPTLGQEFFEIPVTLLNPVDTELTIAWKTSPTGEYPASAPEDFFAISNGQTQITAGSTTSSLRLPVLGDKLDEHNETIAIEGLSIKAKENLAGVTPKFADANAVVEIIDQDAMPKITVLAYRADEGTGGTSTTFAGTIALNATSGRDVTFQYNLLDGSATQADNDYTGQGSGTLTIDEGQTAQPIFFAVNHDNVYEKDEFVNLQIKAVDYALVDVGSRQLIIADDDLPSLTIASLNKLEGNDGENPEILVPVTMTNPAAFPINVEVVLGTPVTNYVANAADYTFVPYDGTGQGALVIDAGNLTANVLVTFHGDNGLEPAEEIPLLLQSPSDGVLLGTPKQSKLIILDDDGPPTVAASPAQAFEADSEISKLRVDVTMSPPTGVDLFVDYVLVPVGGFPYAATSNSDFANNSGTLKIPEHQTEAVLEIDILPDLIDEENEQFEVRFSNPRLVPEIPGKTPKVHEEYGTALLTIIDNDLATISAKDAAVVEGDKENVDLEIPLQLSHAISREMVVRYSVHPINPLGYASSMATADDVASELNKQVTVIVPAGQKSGKIPITIKGDLLDEYDEPLQVKLLGASITEGSKPARTVTQASVTGTILDNDEPPTITVLGGSVVEGDVGEKHVQFTAKLSTPSGRDVPFGYELLDGTATQFGENPDYKYQVGSRAIKEGTTATSFVATIYGDRLDEGDETVGVAVSPGQFATTSASKFFATIIDDDVPVVEIVGVEVVEGTGTGVTEAKVTLRLDKPTTRAPDVRIEPRAMTSKCPSNHGSTQTTSTATGTTTGTYTASTSTQTGTGSTTTSTQTGSSGGQGTATQTNTFTGTTTTTVTTTGTGAQDPVNYKPAKGCYNLAVPYNDFDATAQVAEFDGAQELNLTIPIYQDNLDEYDEWFEVAITDVVGLIIGENSSAAVIILDDDTAVATAGDGFVEEGDSGTTILNVPVTLSNPMDRPSTLTYQVQRQSTSIDDHWIGIENISIDAGTITTQIPIAVNGDLLDEIIHEKFVVALLEATNDLRVSWALGIGTILDDDQAVLGIIPSAVKEGDYGVTDMPFVVETSLLADRQITVKVQTSPVHPGSFEDFVADNFTVKIPAFAKNTTAIVKVIGDYFAEDDEDVAFCISEPTVAIIPGHSFGICQDGTIIDDDTVGFAKQPDSAALEVSEDGDYVGPAIALTSKPRAPVEITMMANEQLVYGRIDSETNNLVMDQETIRFTVQPDEWFEGTQFYVGAVDDFFREGGHTVQFTTVAKSADPRYDGLTTTWVVDIEDNDYATVHVHDDETEVAEGGDPSRYYLSLQTQPYFPVIVTIRPDEQVRADVKTVTIQPENWNKLHPVNLVAVDDPYAEGDPHYATVTHVVKSGDPDFHGVPTLPARVPVIEDDFPVIITKSIGKNSATEGGADGAFTFELGSKPHHPVTISILGDGSARALANLWTIDPETWNVPRTVPVRAIDDNVHEDDVAATISLIANSNDGMYAGVEAKHEVMVIDDDDYPVIKFAKEQHRFYEGQLGIPIEVELSHPSSREITVFHKMRAGATITPGEDIAYQPGSFKIPPGQTRAQFPVEVLQDELVEPTEYAWFELTAAVDAVIVFEENAGQFVLESDDGFKLIWHTAGGPLRVSEDGDSDVVRVKLNTKPSGTVVVDAAVTDNTEARLLGGRTLEFTPGDWFLERRVTVAGVDDKWTDFNVASQLLLSVNHERSTADVAAMEGAAIDIVTLDNEGTDDTTGTTGNTGSSGGSNGGSSGGSSGGDTGATDEQPGNDETSGQTDDAGNDQPGGNNGQTGSNGGQETSGPGNAGVDEVELVKPKQLQGELGISRNEGKVLLDWPVVPGAMGYQVWRYDGTNWELAGEVANIPSFSEADDGSLYHVTAFTSRSADGGWAPDAAAMQTAGGFDSAEIESAGRDANQLDGDGELVAANDGLPAWAWIAIGVGALAGMGAIGGLGVVVFNAIRVKP